MSFSSELIQSQLEFRQYPITEDYQIFSKEILGKGVNGKVFKCRNIHNQMICALKVYFFHFFEIF